MAIFQNTTPHAIMVMINGVRKSIKPGQFINGPENLNTIPGLALIDKDKKTYIPKTVPQDKIQPVSPPQIKNFPMITPTFDKNGNTDLSKEVEAEYQYMKQMKDLGKNPSVTIAILTKNFLNLITECCESVLKHVLYPHVTLLIADTGTTDPSVRDYYNTLQNKCTAKGWNYQFIQFNNFHYSYNYNKIADQVTTDYFLLQNNDTVALNDYVSEMLSTALLRKVGSTGCRMLYPDRIHIQHDGQTFYNAPNLMYGGAGHVNLRRPVQQVPEHESYTDIVDGNTAAGVLMRTSEYKIVGGLEEKYKDIFQDVDLMIKIPQMLKKYNYCNKQAKIVHIDNASRLSTGHDPKRHAAMFEDTQFLKQRIISNGWAKGCRPNQVDFSIITLVHNLNDYEDLCNSLKKQIGSHTVEIIGIPNFYNFFTSIYKAYNTASDISNGKYSIFCHDDIVVPPDWLTRIKNHIHDLENQKINWGVLGPAGVFLENNNSAFFLLNERGEKLYHTQKHIIHDKARYEVASLDELCLITKKSNNLRFNDKQLTGFHFYGINIAIEAKIKNLKTFAIDAYCHHKSDGYKNISTPDSFKIYEESAKNINLYAKLRSINHWRSTTAMGKNDVITLFTKPPK